MKLLSLAVITLCTLFSLGMAQANAKPFPFVGVWEQSEDDNKLPGHKIQIAKDGEGFIEYHDLEKTQFSYRVSGKQATFNIKQYHPGYEFTDEPYTDYLTFQLVPQSKGYILVLKMVKGYSIYSKRKVKETISPYSITLYSLWHSEIKPTTKQKSVNVKSFVGRWKTAKQYSRVLDIWFEGKRGYALINSKDFDLRSQGSSLMLYRTCLQLFMPSASR